MLGSLRRTDCIGIGPGRLLTTSSSAMALQRIDERICRRRCVSACCACALPLSTAAKPMATLFSRYLSTWAGTQPAWAAR